MGYIFQINIFLCDGILSEDLNCSVKFYLFPVTDCHCHGPWGAVWGEGRECGVIPLQGLEKYLTKKYLQTRPPHRTPDRARLQREASFRVSGQVKKLPSR